MKAMICKIKGTAVTTKFFDCATLDDLLNVLDEYGYPPMQINIEDDEHGDPRMSIELFDGTRNVVYQHLIKHQETTLLRIRNNILGRANDSIYNEQILMDAADDLDQCIAELKSVRKAI